MHSLRRLFSGTEEETDAGRYESMRAVFQRLPTLQTARLTLRALEPQDAQGLYELNSDPLVTERSMSPMATSVLDCRLEIERWRLSAKRGRAAPWALIQKSTGRMVGTCGVTGVDTPNKSVTVGFALVRDLWGEGLMTEALARIIDFLFEETDVHRISALCFTDNPASKRVMEKNGMQFEGLLRENLVFDGRRHDSLLHTILRTDWEARQP